MDYLLLVRILDIMALLSFAAYRIILAFYGTSIQQLLFVGGLTCILEDLYLQNLKSVGTFFPKILQTVVLIKKIKKKFSIVILSSNFNKGFILSRFSNLY